LTTETPQLRAMADALDRLYRDYSDKGMFIETIDLARAALTAIREPSDEMVASGAVDYAATSNFRLAWRGMVDVALTGRPSQLDKTRDP